MDAVQCFLITPTDRARRWLRRATYGDQRECYLRGHRRGHQALVRIEETTTIPAPGGGFTTEPQEWPETDPRWPTHCMCGYRFRDTDPWGVHAARIYVDIRGTRYVLPDELGGSAPVGALWYSDWLLAQGYQGPDGRSLSVKTPVGIWNLDVPLESRHWTREGEAPFITVLPPTRYRTWQGYILQGLMILNAYVDSSSR